MKIPQQHPQALRCLVAIAREGTVSAAATALHLSQPAVSLQIKGLEQATGLILFNRTPRGLVLTKEGAALVPEAENALRAMAGFDRAALALRTPARESLRIGTIVDPEFTRIGAFLKELTDVAPHIEAHLRHGISDDVLVQVGRGDLDLGFYLDLPERPKEPKQRTDRAGRRPSGIQVKPLLQFFYRVMAPPGWESRVLGQGWKSLATLPWLATPEASAHRRLLASVFEPLGVEPRRVAMTDQEAAMLDLVESGVGLSLIRDSVSERECRARKLVIADRVSISCALSFVCLRSRLAEPAISTAWAAMDRAWQKKER